MKINVAYSFSINVEVDEEKVIQIMENTDFLHRGEEFNNLVLSAGIDFNEIERYAPEGCEICVDEICGVYNDFNILNNIVTYSSERLPEILWEN